MENTSTFFGGTKWHIARLYFLYKYLNTLRLKFKLLNCVFIQVKENADDQVRMVKLTSVQQRKPKQTTMRCYDRDDDITHDIFIS